MASIHLPRSFEDVTFRDDCIRAVNALIQQGKLTADTCFDFVTHAGKPYVRLWTGDVWAALAAGKVAHVDAVELIVASGTLKDLREGVIAGT